MLRGQSPFALREDVVNRRKRRRSSAQVAPNDADAELLAALKALRGAIAAAHKQPAYVIFPDRTLIEMATERPHRLDDLAGIHGIGAVKLQKYRLSLSRRDPGPPQCLNFPRSRLSGAVSCRRCLAPASTRSNCGGASGSRFPASFRSGSAGGGSRCGPARQIPSLPTRQRRDPDRASGHVGLVPDRKGRFRLLAVSSCALKDPKHDHVVLTLDSGCVVTYNDPRRFGFMDLASNGALADHPSLSGLGAEPLAPEFDAALPGQAVRRRSHASEGGACSIKNALLAWATSMSARPFFAPASRHRGRPASSRTPAAPRPAPRSRSPKPSATCSRKRSRPAARPCAITARPMAKWDIFSTSSRSMIARDCRASGSVVAGSSSGSVQSGRSTFYCPRCQQ